VDLTPSREQRMLIEAARGTLARACSTTHVRAMESDPLGYDPTFWREMARLGWTGIVVPEEAGGGGRTLLDAVILLEEMGRVLLPSPFLVSCILAPALLGAGGERWLSRIAAGEAIASLALVEPGWRDEEGKPTTTFAAGRVTGTKSFVPFAAAADVLLVAVRGGDVVVVPRAREVACTRQRTLGGDHQYEVRFETAAGERIAPAGTLHGVSQRAAVASLAYAVGAAERALELSVEHAKTRVQFGRPIGSFQAVAHRCADMRSDLDAVRYLVYQAAWCLDARGSAELEVGAAKAYGNEALRRVFMHAHQVHGAIGFSIEHDLQLFTRRVKAIELAWGSTATHRERVARAMGL
jgi:alkylation response protein AidB-like acyl-CoA dehydrogenase